MKKIEAIVKSSKLDSIKNALEEIDVFGMTVSEVKGYGQQKGHSELYRGAEYNIEFVPKIKLDIVVVEEKANEVIDAVQKAACTGKIGDGKIFVYPLDDAVRIRTGERGKEAV